ncbi:hypothetical protein AVEN_158639-1 [Araneus ventricosus]|uniref:Uncharacterized protein n=1 Tax=Araneus ventricosus TaxID=182803 RepID=A0A4Y2MWP2_ARAVE|nr:hypothetical protein AVEN_158639-1 [Araneus ventricosus]
MQHDFFHGGLVVRPQLWGRRVPGSKPDSTEDPSCIGIAVCEIIFRGPNILPLVWCGSLKWGRQLKCRPRHLTDVQNYEVRLKIDIVFALEKGTLI